VWDNSTTAGVARWEALCLVLLLLLVWFAFGVLVEIRTAFLKRRHGDFGCYAAPAWAVRTGGDLYRSPTTTPGTYNYPPLFAIADGRWRTRRRR